MMTIDDQGFEQFEVQHTVYALAASPDVAQDGICFAGRASGVYRSEDGGRTWAFTFESLGYEDAVAVTSVAVLPNFASDHIVFVGAKGGVLYSSDGGQTWHEAAFPGPMPLLSLLAVSPNYANDGALLAGTMETRLLYCAGVRSREFGQRSPVPVDWHTTHAQRSLNRLWPLIEPANGCSNRSDHFP